MRICFIGNSGHSGQALSSIRKIDSAEICGFAYECEREVACATKKSYAPFRDIPFFSDYKAMLDAVKPHITVASPIYGNTGKVIIECAKRGIHVLAEKPIAATPEELEAVKDAVKTHNIRLCAMHYLRYTPAFYRAAETVRSGKLGSPRMITAQKSYKWGIRPEWYSDPQLYTGIIPWVGIHAFDWIYTFCGSHIKTVTATTYGEPERAAICSFETENGVFGTVNLDVMRPEGAKTHGDDRIRCVCDNGVIEVSHDKITVTDRDGIYEYTPTSDGIPNLTEEFIKGNSPIPFHEIYRITKSALQANLAARADRTNQTLSQT